MRRLAPILVFAIVVAGFYWALGGPLAEKAGVSGKLTPAADAASGPAERAAPVSSRPASRNLLPSAESEPAESRPESSPASQPATLPVVIIEVVREDGRPIANAILQTDRKQFPDLGDFWTNEAGRAEVPAHPGVTVWMRVSQGAFLPLDREVSLDSGTRHIIVPTRSIVAGRVTVGGLPPDEPVLLTLDQYPQGAYAWTGAEGTFEFFNVPPDWQGDLHVHYLYEMADVAPPASILETEELDTDAPSSSVLPLRAPNPALVVRLVALPAIKGRLMRAGKHEPVAGSGFIVWDDASRWGLESGTDGRFRVNANLASQEATLIVSDSNGLGRRSIHIQGPFPGVRDVGDVEVGPTRSVRFRVHDHEGKPVQDARAEVDGASSRSDRTAADGTASILADIGPGSIRVAKPGYRTATVALPEDDSVLEVELLAGNTLRVEAKLADGSTPPQGLLRVRLSSPGAMFDGGRLDSLLPDPGLEETKTGVGCPLDEEGRCVIGGLAARAEIGIRLLGVAIGEVLDESFVVMDEAGEKTITLHTQTMPRALTGVVQTPDGAPVRATISPGSASADWNHSSEADDAGRFRVDGIFASSLSFVSVWAEGFVPLLVRDVPVGADQVFTIKPGLTVTIELVSEDGRPIRQANVEVRVEAPSLRNNPEPERGRGLGVWIVGGLPDETVGISATVGTAHAGIRHDARIPVARIVIPSTGGAEIHWTRDRRDPAKCRIRVESVPTGAEVFVAVPDEVTDHYLEAQLPPGTWRATALGFDEQAGDWVVLGSSRPFAVRLYEGTAVEVAR